jgi:hypothetical protein
MDMDLDILIADIERGIANKMKGKKSCRRAAVKHKEELERAKSALAKRMKTKAMNILLDLKKDLREFYPSSEADCLLIKGIKLIYKMLY